MLVGKYKVVGVPGKGTLGKQWIVEKDATKYAVKQIDKHEIESRTLRAKTYLRLL